VAREDAEVGVPVPGDQRSVPDGPEQGAEVEPVDDPVLGQQVVREVDELEQVLRAAVGAQVALAPVPKPAIRAVRGARRVDGGRRGHDWTTVKLRRRTRSMIALDEIPFA